MSAATVSPWLRLWGAYVRWSARQPALASLVPFVPVLALWAALALALAGYVMHRRDA